MSHATLFGCRAKYVGNFVPITRSIGRPLLSLRSSSRHALACARISDFGYHLNGTLTSSASWPCTRSSATSSLTCDSAPPRTKGTCASQTRTVLAMGQSASGGVTKIDDVAVDDDVLLAFEAELSVFAASG